MPVSLPVSLPEKGSNDKDHDRAKRLCNSDAVAVISIRGTKSNKKAGCALQFSLMLRPNWLSVRTSFRDKSPRLTSETSSGSIELDSTSGEAQENFALHAAIDANRLRLSQRSWSRSMRRAASRPHQERFGFRSTGDFPDLQVVVHIDQVPSSV